MIILLLVILELKIYVPQLKSSRKCSPANGLERSAPVTDLPLRLRQARFEGQSAPSANLTRLIHRQPGFDPVTLLSCSAGQLGDDQGCSNLHVAHISRRSFHKTDTQISKVINTFDVLGNKYVRLATITNTQMYILPTQLHLINLQNSVRSKPTQTRTQAV